MSAAAEEGGQPPPPPPPSAAGSFQAALENYDVMEGNGVVGGAEVWSFPAKQAHLRKYALNIFETFEFSFGNFQYFPIFFETFKIAGNTSQIPSLHYNKAHRSGNIVSIDSLISIHFRPPPALKNRAIYQCGIEMTKEAFLLGKSIASQRGRKLVFFASLPPCHFMRL